MPWLSSCPSSREADHHPWSNNSFQYRGGVGSDRDRKDAEKLQLEQLSPGKPAPKSIAQKKRDSSSGLLIQIFVRKPIRRPMQKPKKVFHSIENNQEKSKEPEAVCAVQKKKTLLTKAEGTKRKSLVPGTSSLLYYPEGQKGRGRRSVPRQEQLHQKREKRNSGGNILAAAAPLPSQKSKICKGKQISKNHQNRKIIPLDLTRQEQINLFLWRDGGKHLWFYLPGESKKQRKKYSF